MKRNPAKPMLYFKVLQLLAATPERGVNRHQTSPWSILQVATVKSNVKGCYRPMR